MMLSYSFICQGIVKVWGNTVTVIVRAGAAIWLNPFATVLFTVCSAVTVECFVPVLHGCVWYVCCYVREKTLLQCLCNY